VISHERVKEGLEAGVVFNIDLRAGKRAKKKRRAPLRCDASRRLLYFPPLYSAWISAAERARLPALSESASRRVDATVALFPAVIKGGYLCRREGAVIDADVIDEATEVITYYRSSYIGVPQKTGTCGCLNCDTIFDPIQV
jgi:hypothetical protein